MGSTIDSALLQYNNQTLKTPRALQGSGAKLASNQHIDRKSKLYAECQEFESLFVNMMLKEMRKTVDKSGLIDGGHGEEIFQDMLYDEYAKDMTKAANFGMADKIYLQLLGR
jgi:peptidoglycan hydrolase FlgJ